MSSVEVSIIADNIIEENETFVVTLSMPLSVNKGITIAGGSRRRQATVTIIDSTGEIIAV